MSLSRTEWTAEMLNALPDDGQRYEVIDGELFVTPAPAFVHQRAVLELALILAPHTKQLMLDLFDAPIDITFSERRVLQPDVSVLPRTAGGKHATKFSDVNQLMLAVEVLSPSSQRTDRQEKRWVYQQERVAEYWIVDIEARTVERWTPSAQSAEVLTDTMAWHPMALHPALVIDLKQYFRNVLDD